MNEFFCFVLFLLESIFSSWWWWWLYDTIIIIIYMRNFHFYDQNNRQKKKRKEKKLIQKEDDDEGIKQNKTKKESNRKISTFLFFSLHHLLQGIIFIFLKSSSGFFLSNLLFSFHFNMIFSDRLRIYLFVWKKIHWIRFESFFSSQLISAVVIIIIIIVVDPKIDVTNDEWILGIEEFRFLFCSCLFGFGEFGKFHYSFIRFLKFRIYFGKYGNFFSSIFPIQFINYYVNFDS